MVSLLTDLASKAQGTSIVSFVAESGSYFDKLVGKMPAKLKGGSILIESDDLMHYLILCFGTTLFFFLVYMVSNAILSRIEGEAFDTLDSDTKIWKNSSLSTILHHVTNISLLTYTIYYSCSTVDGQPWPTEEGGTFTKLGSDKRWGWFRSETCYAQVNKGFAYSLFLCMGYSAFDFVLIAYWTEKRTRIIK